MVSLHYVDHMEQNIILRALTITPNWNQCHTHAHLYNRTLTIKAQIWQKERVLLRKHKILGSNMGKGWKTRRILFQQCATWIIKAYSTDFLMASLIKEVDKSNDCLVVEGEGEEIQDSVFTENNYIVASVVFFVKCLTFWKLIVRKF